MMAPPPLRRHVLSDGDVSVALLSLGCITQDWRVPLGGAPVPVVLGYADPQDYLRHPTSMGVIAGRVANRISGARFWLDGALYQLPANEGPTHLHGGPGGLQKRIWHSEADGNRAVRFTLTSEHGDQGYPGQVHLAVTVSMTGHDLRYEMQATPDRPTPISLAQHSYYNLMGQGDIAAHRLQIMADRCTPTDKAKIPTGRIAEVARHGCDFTTPRAVGLTDHDINLVLNGGTPAATLSAPNGMTLTLTTDQPCLQLYTGAGLTPKAPPHAGQNLQPFAGLCLEPQHYPNAVNTPEFPLTLATPDAPYRQTTTITIAPGQAA